MRIREGDRERPRDSHEALFLEALFLEALRVRRASPSTVDQARRVLTRFRSHLRDEDVHDLTAVSEEHLVSFVRTLVHRDGTKLSSCTRSTYLAVLRRFFAFLMKRGLLLEDPAVHLALPLGQRLPRVGLSRLQAHRLMNVPDKHTPLGVRDRAILEVFYGTGIRLAELLRLDLLDLNLREMTLLIRNGKGRKDRLVPVLGRAAAALEVYLRETRPALVKDPGEPALFVSRGGTRLHRSLIDVRVQAYGRRIDLRVSPHVLRHACATHLLQGGADIRHIQALLGHRNLETTQVYTRVVLKDLRAALARAHPRERRQRGQPKPG